MTFSCDKRKPIDTPCAKWYNAWNRRKEAFAFRDGPIFLSSGNAGAVCRASARALSACSTRSRHCRRHNQGK